MSETRGYIRTADDKGSINISQSVVATIAATAANDIDGVYALYQTPGKELAGVSGRKGISKGAKITIEKEGITVDVYIIAQLGYSISDVGENIQKAVMTAIDEAVGVKINTVNVHIGGIAAKKAPPPAAKGINSSAK